jgi:DNA repair protein RecN (Recombination protein N)
MLNWLSVHNLAIVEEAEIEFGPAFNVITGETGAGKSVIMGALGLLLGNRADKSAIRTGADHCEISAGLRSRPARCQNSAPTSRKTRWFPRMDRTTCWSGA